MPRTELQELEEAKPFIRSSVALAIFLFRPQYTIEDAYKVADCFMKKLRADLGDK